MSNYTKHVFEIDFVMDGMSRKSLLIHYLKENRFPYNSIMNSLLRKS